MKINCERLKELRTSKQWSQEQLAELTGLNLRTIQRLESGSKISTESLRSLAAVFEVTPESLLEGYFKPSQPALEAIKQGVILGLEFQGRTSRSDFWWFILAAIMLLAFAQTLSMFTSELFFQLAQLLVLVPWLAACTRRLRDAGLSPWWQLMNLVPLIGSLFVLYLTTYPTLNDSSVEI